MAKHPRPSINGIIDKYLLLRTFKMMRRYPDPHKVWLKRGLFWNGSNSKKFTEKYLDTLIALGVIEQVPAIYNIGGKMRVRKDVAGYRLKQNLDSSQICENCGYVKKNGK